MRRMRRALFGGRRARRILGPVLHPALERLRLAHARREAGDFISAAAEFHELGERGEAEGIPRSVQAFVLAGQCYLLAGHREQGLADLRRSIEAATRFGQLPRLAAAAPRIAAELRAGGLGPEADAFLKMLAPAAPEPPTAQPSAAIFPNHPRLPPKCPSCGGTIHPGEVEWVDPHSVSCDYCGSVVQAAQG
jgi:hypothetical protein